nr:amidohydrolase [uncultured Allomuricauda sp.]
MDNQLVALRHKLHADPDLSNREQGTADIIKEFIAPYSPSKIIEGIGGAGMAVVFKFSDNGPRITLRCELDALPIQETNTFPHKSNTNGVSHKCGHDGHMTIMAGIAKWLSVSHLKSGTIILLFQPAEETGEGALRMVKDKKFKGLQTDYVFALHNIPKVPLHSILITEQGFSAEVISVSIQLKGKESHASEPENGINPALALAEIVQSISKLNAPEPMDPKFAIVTPIHLKMGQTSYGISPANAELHYTLRTWNTDQMKKLQSKLTGIVDKVCKQWHLGSKLDWMEYFPASSVHNECTHLVRQAASSNNFPTVERPVPFKFGEDFGWFSKSYKTSMFGIGAGESTPALHNADYDFPDELITTGISMFKSIILNLLGKNK